MAYLKKTGESSTDVLPCPHCTRPTLRRDLHPVPGGEETKKLGEKDVLADAGEPDDMACNECLGLPSFVPRRAFDAIEPTAIT